MNMCSNKSLHLDPHASCLVSGAIVTVSPYYDNTASAVRPISMETTSSTRSDSGLQLKIWQQREGQHFTATIPIFELFCIHVKLYNNRD
ncbi:hypothetical protein QQF64_029747 [Cirrhinus molitorella]|uniref:Uncharacterized protein n=1 Tax=Cirrhinus molitorella TaxID=172907 RepID=A0ABR3N1H4_9TELE